MQRFSKKDVETRVQNLNRRLANGGSAYRYFSQMGNGHCNLYRISPTGEMVAHVESGTKREISEWLNAAMIAIDDFNLKGDDNNV